MSLIEGDDAANALLGGGGNDIMFGFEGNDTLSGGDGDDTLNGGAGNDVLQGGTGFDIASYASDASEVSVTLDVSGPFDTEGSGTDTLLSIEGLEGSTHDDVLTGNFRGNQLNGGAGHDILQGLEGLDTLDGGHGDDTINAGDDDDTVSGSDGDDQLHGNDGDDVMIGGAGRDVISGGAGNDRFVFGREPGGAHSTPLSADLIGDMEGGGQEGGDVIDLTAAAPDRRLLFLAEQIAFQFSGLGVASGRQLPDEMIGDGFADVVWALDDVASQLRLWVDADDDGVFGMDDQLIRIECPGGNWMLAAQDFVGLFPAIQGATGNDLLAGTVAADVILGRGGDDSLSGGEGQDEVFGGSGNDELQGGGGRDTLVGGAGDDVYVDSAGDVIVETAGGGRDRVVSQQTISLSAMPFVEDVTLTGTGNINAAGSVSANVLTGNAGNNVLNGGAGADTMAGGAGNDIYYVDTPGDVTIEAAGQGVDLISASVSRSLSANVENLNLSGSANIDGNGNALSNVINGNAGNNILRGYEGADTLNGGAGNDILLGSSASDALNPGNDSVRDIIRFSAVADSTGSQRDIVSGMDLNGEDRLDFPMVPSSLAVVNGGPLNLATINGDLAAAVDAALVPGGAVAFDPSAGSLNVGGHMFVVVDANGDGIYKPNQDYVVQLVNASGGLTLDDFI